MIRVLRPLIVLKSILFNGLQNLVGIFFQAVPGSRVLHMGQEPPVFYR